MRFSEALRETHADQWNRVINHKFTNELANGVIDHQGKKQEFLFNEKLHLTSYLHNYA